MNNRERYESAARELKEAYAEVERLRKYEDAAVARTTETYTLKAELERLREERDEFNDLYDEAEAEVKRLRAENDDLRMRVSVRDDIIGQHYLDAPK